MNDPTFVCTFCDCETEPVYSERTTDGIIPANVHELKSKCCNLLLKIFGGNPGEQNDARQEGVRRAV